MKMEAFLSKLAGGALSPANISKRKAYPQGRLACHAPPAADSRTVPGCGPKMVGAERGHRAGKDHRRPEPSGFMKAQLWAAIMVWPMVVDFRAAILN